MNASPRSSLPPASYPFDDLEYAMRVKILFVDGRVFDLRVYDYWPMAKSYKDVMDILGQSVDGDDVLFLPDPRIAAIEILEKKTAPNRAGHPEVGFAIKPRMEGFE